MNLFTSDEDLAREQKLDARIPKGMILSREQQRRELMEQMREMREHARWRQFAFLLFIAPAVVALATIIVGWIVAHFVLANR